MRNRVRAGFTLIEVLVATVVLFIAISICTMCFNAGMRSFTRTNDTIETFNACSDILDMMLVELKEADPGSITIPVGTPVASITFTKYHKPLNQTQQVTWAYVPAQQKVRRSYTSSGSPDSMYFGENIKGLTFTRVTRLSVNNVKYTKVTVEITARKDAKSYGRVETVTLRTDITIRSRFRAQAVVKFE